MLPTVRDTLIWPIPGLISCSGVIIHMLRRSIFKGGISKVASLFVQLSTSVSRVVAISDRCVVDVRVCRSIQGVGSTFV